MELITLHGKWDADMVAKIMTYNAQGYVITDLTISIDYVSVFLKRPIKIDHEKVCTTSCDVAAHVIMGIP